MKTFYFSVYLVQFARICYGMNGLAQYYQAQQMHPFKGASYPHKFLGASNGPIAHSVRPDPNYALTDSGTSRKDAYEKLCRIADNLPDEFIMKAITNGISIDPPPREALAQYISITDIDGQEDLWGTFSTYEWGKKTSSLLQLPANGVNLVVAAYQGRVEYVKLCMRVNLRLADDQKIDPNSLDAAYAIASWKGHTVISELLLQRKANPPKFLYYQRHPCLAAENGRVINYVENERQFGKQCFSMLKMVARHTGEPIKIYFKVDSVSMYEHVMHSKFGAEFQVRMDIRDGFQFRQQMAGNIAMSAAVDLVFQMAESEKAFLSVMRDLNYDATRIRSLSFTGHKAVSEKTAQFIVENVMQMKLTGFEIQLPHGYGDEFLKGLLRSDTSSLIDLALRNTELSATGHENLAMLFGGMTKPRSVSFEHTRMTEHQFIKLLGNAAEKPSIKELIFVGVPLTDVGADAVAKFLEAMSRSHLRYFSVGGILFFNYSSYAGLGFYPTKNNWKGFIDGSPGQSVKIQELLDSGAWTFGSLQFFS